MFLELYLLITCIKVLQFMWTPRMLHVWLLDHATSSLLSWVRFQCHMKLWIVLHQHCPVHDPTASSGLWLYTWQLNFSELCILECLWLRARVCSSWYISSGNRIGREGIFHVDCETAHGCFGLNSLSLYSVVWPTLTILALLSTTTSMC